MHDWKPIETARKDGTRILAWSTAKGLDPKYARAVLVEWCEHIEPWGGSGWAEEPAGPGYQNSYDDLSHWMGLPSSPTNA